MPLAGLHVEKSCNRLLLVTMCARMCVMYGGRHRVIHDEPYTSVCVALCDVWFKVVVFLLGKTKSFVRSESRTNL